MAEGALFDLAGNVFQLLGSIIVDEVKLASGVKTEIENLKSTVSSIQAALRDAEKRSSHSYRIKDWLSKLKDVLHDADDLLDDFSTEVMRRKVKTKKGRPFSSSSNPLAFSPTMGREIKAIREKLNAIAKDKEDFNFSKSLDEPQVMNRGDRDTYSFVLEDEVIGREDDKKEIMKRLFDDNVVENVSIIPIVGFGGLGKTTLAQLVYNDEYVRTEFQIKVWVCVSDVFNVQRIVKEILELLTKTKHDGSIEMLQTPLRDALNGKKYLIVLDDLWNEESSEWLLLRSLLMGGGRGSRMIVTTRSESVARMVGATSWHPLGCLPYEKAWSLFVKVAFENGQLPENEAFVSLGSEIMRKCGGVPLAIRTIASLLRTKATVNEWGSFKDYELSKITQEDETVISSTLKLSYDHLPTYLKQCFAYCRLFPKDYKIDVTKLINLWAAQGFIKLSDSKQRVEDVGREYFMILLRRCFFQDVEKDYHGIISYCKIHDLMHDLAALVAGMESTRLTSSGEFNGEKVRHVSFDLEDSSRKLSIFNIKGLKIRTILIASVGGKLRNLNCKALVSNLNYLRTLDLSELNLCEVPHSIGELKHLRYLDLSENGGIKFLPKSITKLLNLLILKLRRCVSLKELPPCLKNLVKLRHLDIIGCRELTHMPLGLGHLTSLEILTEFVVRQVEDWEASSWHLPKKEQGRSGGWLSEKASSWNWHKKKQGRSGGRLSELKELSNLGGKLLIRGLGHGEDDTVECKTANMKEKQHLHDLTLWWDRGGDGETECYDEMSLEGLQPHPNLRGLNLLCYMGVRIPSWVSSHTNLVQFELYRNSRLLHLPPLNQLPFLSSIILMEMQALEYISDEESGSSSSSSSKTPFFPSLSCLSIFNCPELKGWWRNSDDDDDNEPHHLLLPSFPPSLSDLQIWDCPNLTSMPLIPDLTNIMGNCPLLRQHEGNREDCPK